MMLLRLWRAIEWRDVGEILLDTSYGVFAIVVIVSAIAVIKGL